MTTERDQIVKFLRELADLQLENMRGDTSSQRVAVAIRKAMYDAANEIKQGRHIPKRRAHATIDNVLDLAAQTGAYVGRASHGGMQVKLPTPDDSIELTTGDKLDQWGWSLECPRKPGETDDAYRKALLLCCRWEHDSVEAWEAARKAVAGR